jgi:hypothetical protein
VSTARKDVKKEQQVLALILTGELPIFMAEGYLTMVQSYNFPLELFLRPHMLLMLHVSFVTCPVLAGASSRVRSNPGTLKRPFVDRSWSYDAKVAWCRDNHEARRGLVYHHWWTNVNLIWGLGALKDTVVVPYLRSTDAHGLAVRCNASRSR